MAEFTAIEVAEYIERGLELAGVRSAGRCRETHSAFLYLVGRTYCAGALGLALIGKAGDPKAALDSWLRVSNVCPAARFAAAAGLLGISEGLARLIELNHRNGVPAAEIAGCLRIGTLGLSFRSRPAEPPLTKTAEASSDREEAPADLHLRSMHA